MLTAALALPHGLSSAGEPDQSSIDVHYDKGLRISTLDGNYAAKLEIRGQLRYTNGGHNPALVIRASGEHEELKPTGLPVGLMPEAQYTQDSVELGPGDLLVLYTDGITEAANPEDDEYGIERLAAICSENRQASLDDLAAAIEQNLDDFAQGVPYADDRTFVLGRRLPS